MINKIKSILYRFKNPDLHRRMSLARAITRLSDFITHHSFNPILIDKNGNAFFIMEDKIKIFYNPDINQGTLGDGQSLGCYHKESTYLEDAKAAEKVIFQSLPQQCVYIDIGANNGYFYTLQILSKINDATAICFEPDPYILPHLHKNISANHCGNAVTVVEKGVSDKQSTFYLKKGLGASGYLVEETPQNPDQYHMIETVTLDSYVTRNTVTQIDFIKIDIEGGEYKFLVGAKNTLEKHTPIILIELRDELLHRSGSSFKQVSDFLCDLGYILYKSPYNDDYFAVQPSHKMDTILKNEQFKKI